jgi:transposase
VLRGDLDDAQWAWIEPVLPTSNGRGRPWRCHRTVVNGILWILRTGSPWRDLRRRYGPWQTVYSRFVRWRREGVWMRIFLRLLAHANATGRIAWRGCAVDGTYVRAHQHAAGASRRVSPAEEKGEPFLSCMKRLDAVVAA